MKRLLLTGSGRWPGLLCLFLASVALYALLLQTFVLPHYPGGIDFYPVWKAARAFFLFHRDPYSQQVTHDIQIDIYGKTASVNQEPYIFIYPLYLLFLVFPLTWLSFLDALAVWLAFLQIGVGTVFFLLLSHYELGQRPFTRGIYFLWSLVLFPTIAGFWLAQPSVLIFILFGCACLALYHQRDWLAGICLGLTLIKLYVILLPVCFLLIYALSRRRYKALLGYGGISFCLLVVSFLIQPSWVAGFLTSAGLWTNETEALSHDVSALQLFTDAARAPLSTILLVGIIIILALLLSVWVHALKEKGDHFELALVITLLFQATVLPHQHAPNQMLLIIPGLYVLKQCNDRRAYIPLWLLAIGALIIPWLVRILIPNPYAGDQWIIVPIPLLLALALLLIRKVPIKEKTDSASTAQTRALKGVG